MDKFEVVRHAEDLRRTDFIIAVVGPTGTGKSTFVDAASRQDGKNVLSNLKPDYGTGIKAIRCKRFDKEAGISRGIVLIDTPGFADNSDGANVLSNIGIWLGGKERRYRTHNLFGIVYLYDISKPRTTTCSVSGVLGQLEDLCGNGEHQPMRNVLLSTTMWKGQNDMADNDPKVKELLASWWKPMRDRGSIHSPFDIVFRRHPPVDLWSEASSVAWKVVEDLLRRQLLEDQPGSAVEPSSPSNIMTEDLHDGDTIIAMMGHTGSGKSSFVEKATGIEGVGHALQSCTTGIRVVKVIYMNAPVVFVDTPGFDDTNLGEVQVLKMVADWLKQTYREGIKLSGILYFHRITDNRMSSTPLKNIKMFEQLCGKKALKNVILTTTMWDNLPDNSAIGRQREEELTKNYWKSMISNGSRTARFLHTQESAWAIVEPLIMPVSAHRRQVTLLQAELVDRQLLVRESAAGRQLFSDLAAFTRRQEDTWKSLKRQREGEFDEDTVERLALELENVGNDRQRAVDAMEDLKVPLTRRLQVGLGLRVVRHLGS